jgi:carbamoyltransferase
MSYNILGINPGHNGSAALVVDGEVVYYVEEERLSRAKYDGNPFRGMLDIMQKWHVDELVIAGTGQEEHKLPWTGEDAYTALVRKFYPNVKVTKLGNEHHLGHVASAFYNSGFEKAIAIIVDGAGSLKQEKLDEKGERIAEGYETESIWHCEYPTKFSPILKVYGSNSGPKAFNGVLDFDGGATTITKTYEAVSQYLGFGFIEAGKTMGLAPYGKQDDSIPNLFNGNRGSKDVFVPFYPAGAFIDEARFPQFSRTSDPKEWHNDPEKLTDIEKNLAWKIQQDTQRLVGDYIERAVAVTKDEVQNIVIAGGYGLNCVANYYFKKRFPHLNIYVEPIAHDAGTSIGVAKLLWHNREENVDARSSLQKSIYYGPEYSTELLEQILDVNRESIKVNPITKEEVAQLIADRNIVTIFQGRSEAGPRALGNRSILYDSRDPEGKDKVNVVKGREWFRPFAGSVLLEDANDWFDMAGLEESPFMMYAVNVAADKVSEIPCVTHVDDTCRVQTVSEENNKHYYELIKAYKDITGVPVIFNTSFNLAGAPLVETLQDALTTLYHSKLRYLYLPELGVIVEKTIEDPKPKRMIVSVPDQVLELPETEE